MRIIQLRVKLAFEDFQVGHQCADFVADQIIDLCIDKLGAEVCDVEKLDDTRINVPDFSIEDELTDTQIEAWQRSARAQFTYPATGRNNK